MDTTVNIEFGTETTPGSGQHCTPEQASELLEGLRTAYQSLLPSERIVVRDIVAQSAQMQFTQEMNARNRKSQGRVPEVDDVRRTASSNRENINENARSQLSAKYLP